MEKTREQQEKYLNFGLYYTEIGNFQLANDNFQKALEFAKTNRKCGYAGLLKHQFKTAIVYLKTIFGSAEQQKYTDQEIEILLMLGNFYRLDHQFETAVEYFKKALKIAEERGDTLQETEALLRLGSAHRMNYQ